MSSEKIGRWCERFLRLYADDFAGGITITEAIYTLVNDSPKLQLISQGAQVIDKLGLNVHLYEVRTGYEQQPIAPYQPDRNWELTLDSFREKLLGHMAPNSNRLFMGMVALGIAAVILSSLFVFRDSLFGGTADPAAASVNAANSGEVVKTPGTIDDGGSSQMEEAQQFYAQVRKLGNPALLNQFLQRRSERGRLEYGQENQFPDKEGKYVVVVDQFEMYAVFQHRDGKFVNLRPAMPFAHWREHSKVK